ncbi:MAG TPA: 2-amino-4-hydroxy-6-hydroxymethyldihydropteridine diphosphokinase [Candidatus Acidoferrum sp.]|jgi:2-amino-4-hydroxy-6-hydroxymethyldihydropteridine diphosphokinase
MTLVYLALGSNVGDREENLREAERRLRQLAITVKRASSIYETAPVDYLDQPWFLNSALETETDLSPHELLRRTREIESAMGSKKPFAKGPRLIDLDILLYGDETIATPDLQVPHPRMLERRFVLVPLAEIAPNYRHPSWQGTVAELLQKTPDRSEVRKYVRKPDPM